MANYKPITQFPNITSIAPLDLMPIVDVNDLTEAPVGTLKKTTIAQLKAYLSGGGTAITWNGVSGTFQAAAINNAYIIQNASATTIQLPATAPIGSIVQVQGLGAGGWILGSVTGQTIRVGNIVTSSGGSVSSTDQWDAIAVVCVVANTTWSMLPPISSDFGIF